MARSSRPDRREWSERHESHGRFLTGEYSPARRATAPSTPSVPPRASAYPSHVVKVRPRYLRTYDTDVLERDVTSIPTVPPAPAVWQYETPLYEAESSLSSLSLAISEATRLHQPAIDELDTTPPPPDSLREKNKSALLELSPLSPREIDRAEIKTTPAFVKLSEAQHLLPVQPLDRVRWWLLKPGRIELILWLCGTVVLICVTGFLIFMLAASMGFVRTAPQQDPTSALCSLRTSTQKAGQGDNCTFSTVSSSNGLRVTMINGDLTETGRALQLQGQGFHPRGHITITRDSGVPCQPNIIQADEHGEFSVVLQLDAKGYWGTGKHQITIHDSESNHSIILNVLLKPQ